MLLPIASAGTGVIPEEICLISTLSWLSLFEEGMSPHNTPMSWSWGGGGVSGSGQAGWVEFSSPSAMHSATTLHAPVKVMTWQIPDCLD